MPASSLARAASLLVLRVRLRRSRRLRHSHRLAAPEVLGAQTDVRLRWRRRWWGPWRWAGSAPVALRQHALQIGAANPHSAPDAERRQRSLIDPVADGLLVELQ